MFANKAPRFFDSVKKCCHTAGNRRFTVGCRAEHLESCGAVNSRWVEKRLDEGGVWRKRCEECRVSWDSFFNMIQCSQFGWLIINHFTSKRHQLKPSTQTWSPPSRSPKMLILNRKTTQCCSAQSIAIMAVQIIWHSCTIVKRGRFSCDLIFGYA